MSYTALVLVAVPVSVLLDVVILRTRLITRRAFWVAYAIVLAFQLLTNAWLTGRGVVRYDAAAVVGGSRAVPFGHGRLLFAPVEDIGFGFALVLQSLAWWVFWGRRPVSRGRAERRASSGTPRRRPAPVEKSGH